MKPLLNPTVMLEKARKNKEYGRLHFIEVDHIFSSNSLTFKKVLIEIRYYKFINTFFKSRFTYLYAAININFIFI